MAIHKHRVPDINISNWGCKYENVTGRHLIDIFRGEEGYTINKIHKVLSKNYQKMVDLVGIGRYQPYYLLLVRKDSIEDLNKIEVKNKSTKTHAVSLVMMIHRAFMNLQYDENNEFPKV